MVRRGFDQFFKQLALRAGFFGKNGFGFLDDVKIMGGSFKTAELIFFRKNENTAFEVGNFLIKGIFLVFEL